MKRGSKDFQPNNSSEQQEAIDNSREALFELIGEEKPINSQFSFGILNDLDNNDNSNNNNSNMKSEKWLTTIVQKKGTHYQTMGHSVRGNIVLYLEEAAWLLNRYALYVHRKSKSSHDSNNDNNGNKNDDYQLESSSSTKTAYTSTIDKNMKENVSFEDYCNLMFTSMDGWITYEKYQVYAYLKRLGYIVQRSPCSSPSSSPSITQTIQNTSPVISSHTIWYDRLIYPFVHFWSGIKSVAYIMLKAIGLISKIKPLACHRQFSNYGKKGKHEKSKHHSF
ncbi:unnamed protein product [Cunninghamella blakesleeana]